MATDSSTTGNRPVVESVQVEPGVNLAQYTKLLPGGLEVFYPERDQPPLEEDLRYIADSFRTAFRTAIQDKYTITDEAAPGVMKVSGQVIETGMQGLFRDDEQTGVMPRGELMLIMEMRDSVTGKLLVRASDRSTTRALDNRLEGAELIDAAAAYWADLFRAWLDRSIGGGS